MTPDDACWAAFLAAGHTQPSVDADFSGWHRGRPHFAVWAIALAAPAIDARLASVRRRFDGLLRPDYARQAHVTLHVCGFPCERARWPDDFARDRLLRQVRLGLNNHGVDLMRGRSGFLSAAHTEADIAATVAAFAATLDEL